MKENGAWYLSTAMHERYVAVLDVRYSWNGCGCHVSASTRVVVLRHAPDPEAVQQGLQEWMVFIAWLAFPVSTRTKGQIGQGER